MSKNKYVVGIDQGTSSTRSVLVDSSGDVVNMVQEDYEASYPHVGWVEQDPEIIWKTTFNTYKKIVDKVAYDGHDVVSIGITNQRETTLLWNRKTGKTVYNAIVWQDRRTADYCDELKAQGKEDIIRKSTGLVIDPYFSATKLKWLLDNIEGARSKAEKGELAFGTIDTFLIWRLTGGKVHATDASNASRTMLFDIENQCWDKKLLNLFDIPDSVLPEVKDSIDDYGATDKKLFGSSIPIKAVLGDQQSATVGQACFESGMIKSTFGTGNFVLLNIGDTPVYSNNRLLTTVLYRLNGKPVFALEGSVFVTGAAVKWLRDGLKIIEEAAETEDLARSINSNGGVYMVPAFTGLGAPHWDAHARGAILGMSRGTGVAEIARATLEAACYQTHDLMVAMGKDCGVPFVTTRVDGGMTENNWMLQFLADITNLTVSRPTNIQTTALGTVYFAGLGAKVFSSLDEISSLWKQDRLFQPQLGDEMREKLIAGWEDTVKRVLTK